MIGVARDARSKRPPTWRRIPWVRCLLTCTPGTRPKRCIVCAGRARCHLCGLDRASPAPDQGPSEILSRGAVGARDAVPSICPIVARSASFRHIGNERGRGFFVQTVLAVRPQTREVLGCMALRTRMSRIRGSRGRAPLPAAQEARARNRCVDASGPLPWDS